MAATTSVTGRGGSLAISIDAGTTYTTVLQAKAVSFSGPKSSFDDKTNLSSPGAVQEFQPTTIDPGTASFTVVWNQSDAGQLALAGAFYAQTLCTFKATYPPQAGLTHGPIKTFSAYISEYGLPSMDIAKTSEFTVQLRITGQITETAGTV